MSGSSSSSASATRTESELDTRTNNQSLQGIFAPVNTPVLNGGDLSANLSDVSAPVTISGYEQVFESKAKIGSLNTEINSLSNIDAPVGIVSPDLYAGKNSTLNSVVNLNISNTDYGAIDAAVGLLDGAGRLVSDALGLSNTAIENSAKVAIDLSTSSLETYERVNSRSLEAITSNNLAALDAVNRSNAKAFSAIGDVSRNAINQVNLANGRALSTVDRTVSGAFNLLDLSSRDFAQSTEKALNGALGFIDNFTRSDDAVNFQQLTKWGALAAVTIAVVWMVKK